MATNTMGFGMAKKESANSIFGASFFSAFSAGIEAADGRRR